MKRETDQSDLKLKDLNLQMQTLHKEAHKAQQKELNLTARSEMLSSGHHGQMSALETKKRVSKTNLEEVKAILKRASRLETEATEFVEQAQKTREDAKKELVQASWARKAERQNRAEAKRKSRAKREHARLKRARKRAKAFGFQLEAQGGKDEADEAALEAAAVSNPDITDITHMDIYIYICISIPLNTPQ